MASFERQLAAELAAVGEAGLMAGVGEPVAQEFFRAAAWIESERIDMRDLARSDNLGIAPCLTPRVAEVVRELAAGAQRSSRLRQLLQRIGSQAGE